MRWELIDWGSLYTVRLGVPWEVWIGWLWWDGIMIRESPWASGLSNSINSLSFGFNSVLGSTTYTSRWVLGGMRSYITKFIHLRGLRNHVPFPPINISFVVGRYKWRPRAIICLGGREAILGGKDEVCFGPNTFDWDSRVTFAGCFASLRGISE